MEVELACKFIEPHWEFMKDTKRFVTPPQPDKKQIKNDMHNWSTMGWSIYKTITKVHCKYTQLNISGDFGKGWKY